MLRWPEILISGLLLGAVPLAAQLPSSATLQGAYNFRYLAVNTGAATATALSAGGTITFDGKGGFTISGNKYSGGASSALSCPSGGCSYSVLPSGAFSMDNPIAGTDVNGTAAMVFGGIGTGNILVGSSTEVLFGDLFVAMPQAASSAAASNATLNGTYHLASLEFPGGGTGQVTDTFFDATADGKGNLGNVTIKGAAANVNSAAAQTQTSTGATYSVTANGTGTLTLPAPSGTSTPLLSGTKNLYVSSDGNFFVAGGSSNYDMVVGVKSLSGTSNQTPLNGIYFTGVLSYDSSGDAFYSSQGAANDTGNSDGLEIVYERVNDPSFGPYDYTYDDNFTFNGNGSISYSSSAWAAGAGGNIVVSAGLSTNFQLWVYVKSVPMNGTGVFLNPQAIVNAANSAPFLNSVSPGEFVSLYGTGLVTATAQATTTPFPTTLGNIQQVTASWTDSSGTAHSDKLPLYYVAPKVFGNTDLINAILPYTIPSDGSLVSLQVTTSAGTSNTVQEYTATTSPGFFTIPPGGVGDGAIQHSDYTTVNSSSPAKIGETVQIYLTGLGPLQNPVTAGTVAPSSPLPVTSNQVDGVYVDCASASSPCVPATVTYQGLSPGSVGLYQLNVVIPSGITTGQSVLVEIDTIDATNQQMTIPIAK